MYQNGHNLSGQVRSGQVRSGQVRSGQVRSGQVRSGQVRSGLTAPFFQMKQKNIIRYLMTPRHAERILLFVCFGGFVLCKNKREE